MQEPKNKKSSSDLIKERLAELRGLERAGMKNFGAFLEHPTHSISQNDPNKGIHILHVSIIMNTSFFFPTISYVHIFARLLSFCWPPKTIKQKALSTQPNKTTLKENNCLNSSKNNCLNSCKTLQS